MLGPGYLLRSSAKPSLRDNLLLFLTAIHLPFDTLFYEFGSLIAPVYS